MEFLFIGAWFVGMAGWLYSIPFWFRDWKGEGGARNKRRFRVGCGVFSVSLAMALVFGTIAEVWGGGWE